MNIVDLIRFYNAFLWVINGRDIRKDLKYLVIMVLLRYLKRGIL